MKWFKRIGILVLLGLLITITYEFFIEDMINDLKKQRIENRLKENFYSHQQDFLELRGLCSISM